MKLVDLTSGPVAMGALLALLACSGGTDSTTPPPPPVQKGTVSGRVLDDSARAVVGAGLTLSATGKTSLSTTSGSDGRYTFTQVEAGTWTLSITAPAGYTAPLDSKSVAVAAGEQAAADFSLKKDVQPPPGSTVGVAIVDFGFSPADLTVAVGTTVKWTNTGAVAHTVTGVAAGLNSGTLAAGATYSKTFNTKGTFSYICNFHNSMTGTVTVQ